MKTLHPAIALLLLLLTVIVACKKDNSDCEDCNIQVDSVRLKAFPLDSVLWKLYMYHSYTDIDGVEHVYSRNDSITLAGEVLINTRTIPQNGQTLSDAAPSTDKYYNFLFSRVRLLISVGTDYSFTTGFDTLTYFRLDTVENILYEAFLDNNQWYENPIFDYDLLPGDTLRYYNTIINTFKQTPIISRDSLLVNNYYWPRCNGRVLADIRVFKYVLDFYIYPGSVQQKIFFRTDSLSNGW